MDELLDILDERGNYTHTTALKSKVHQFGLYHATVHIWIYTQNKEVLLQQRGLKKNTYPGYWDVSVAGHVIAGESIVEGALREVEEEIGLKITADRLHKITVKKGERIHPNGIIDREFYHIFLLELKEDFASLSKQDDEVEAIDLFELSILKRNTRKEISLVPNTKKHYKFIYKAILDKLLTS